MSNITLNAHNGATFAATFVDASQILMIQESWHGCDDDVPEGTATLLVTTFGRLYAKEDVESVRAAMFAAAGQVIANRGAMFNDFGDLFRQILGPNGPSDTE
jgi:hypothetical protein